MPLLNDLPLGRPGLDRDGARRVQPDLMHRLLSDPATLVADLIGDTMAVDPASGALLLRAPGPDDGTRLGFYLGLDTAGPDPVACVALVDDGPAGGEPVDERVSLREAGERLSARDADIFTTAVALANWHRSHTHCPRCGEGTVAAQAGWIRRCERDGSEHYPRTDAAVIMAVIDDADRLLIARGATWPEGRFSVLAGFVEPGETFEAAVAREVAEEVGVAVTDVEYLGSQPWPFPSSLMVGCTCRASSTELVIDPTEIAEARWVSRDDYLGALDSHDLRTPTGISIASRIIARWLDQSAGTGS